MSTTETSILDDIIESAAKKRRWLILPLYGRIIVIFSTIAGGLLNTLILAGALFTEEGHDLFKPGERIPIIMAALILLTFFLGNLFLWMEKKSAIYWGYASSVCALVVTLGIANFLNQLTKTPMSTMLPLVLLYVSFIFQLRKIRKNWMENGVTKRELS
ncbi:hypothetical protein [Chitinophaga sp. Cy-1792]|uniref:hypothetical protein n=1 Tax=Chitinophaga sp. Cy-1792 TaxID=2608339 RepID=UPI00141E54A6|nr:hypothetical protein [Chitinophaga sp. Cy-1792]NIG54790.1 hypothetical protein [Chitinophaga sp. Cy-1792]